MTGSSSTKDVAGGGVREIEMGDRIVAVDAAYPSTHRGLLKAVQMMLSLLGLVLSAASHRVEYEGAFAITVAFVGMLVAFGFLLANTLMLNRTIQQLPWSAVELIFYGLMVILYFLAAILIAVLSANHWAEWNPRWQLIPALASGTLFVCMVLFGIDLILQLRSWRRYSWRPGRSSTDRRTTLPESGTTAATRPSPRAQARGDPRSRDLAVATGEDN